MPRATVRQSGSNVSSCPNCGQCPHARIDVITVKSIVAWTGCERCWPRVIRKNQLRIVSEFCRLSDNPPAADPAKILR